MIVLVVVLAIALCICLGYIWTQRQLNAECRGVLTANYIVLKRLALVLERVGDSEWQHYTVPKIKYVPMDLQEGVTPE